MNKTKPNSLAGSGRIRPDPAGSTRIQPDPAGSSRIQPDPAGGSGQIRLDHARSSWIQPEPDGSGRIWLDLAGSGRIRPDLVGSSCIEYWEPNSFRLSSRLGTKTAQGGQTMAFRVVPWNGSRQPSGTIGGGMSTLCFFVGSWTCLWGPRVPGGI